MNQTIKTIGRDQYFQLLKQLSIDVEDRLFHQVRSSVKDMDLPVNEEDLGEIVNDVLRTSYFMEFPEI